MWVVNPCKNHNNETLLTVGNLTLLNISDYNFLKLFSRLPHKNILNNCNIEILEQIKQKYVYLGNTAVGRCLDNTKSQIYK